MAGQVALWAVLWSPVWRYFRQLCSTVSLLSHGTIVGLAAILVLFGLFLVGHAVVPPNVHLPVLDQKLKVATLSSFGMAVLTVALAGIHVIGISAANAPSEGRTAQSHIVNLRTLRRSLNFLLVACGLIIGGGTLTTGALFNAISALNPLHQPLPKSAALLYGAYGSAVICLIYLPAHNAMLKYAEFLCEQFLPTPATSEEIVAWYEKRTKLETYLGASESPVDSIKTGIAILAPIAGSSVALLLGKT